jgi:hypothetical protein
MSISKYTNAVGIFVTLTVVFGPSETSRAKSLKMGSGWRIDLEPFLER